MRDGDWPLKNVPFLIIKTSRVDFTRKGCQFCSIWLNMGRKNRSIDFSFHTPASVRLIYTYALFTVHNVAETLAGIV